jgi:hypothetical protein
LGLSPLMADLGKRVHEGHPLPLPEELRGAALRLLRPQYDFIASEFTNLPHAWRDRMAELTPAPQPIEARI